MKAKGKKREKKVEKKEKMRYERSSLKIYEKRDAVLADCRVPRVSRFLQNRRKIARGMKDHCRSVNSSWDFGAAKRGSLACSSGVDRYFLTRDTIYYHIPGYRFNYYAIRYCHEIRPAVVVAKNASPALKTRVICRQPETSQDDDDDDVIIISR